MARIKDDYLDALGYGSIKIENTGISLFDMPIFVTKETIYGTFIKDNIKSVVFSPPATIVFWHDGSKTVVKTSPHDTYDREKGILWAYFIKHAKGSKTKLQKEIRKLVEGE